MSSESLRRLDDEQLQSLTKELGSLKIEVETLKDKQGRIIVVIEQEAEDNKYIRGRVSSMEAQLEDMHNLLQQINGDKEERSKLIQTISEQIAKLHGCIQETNEYIHSVAHTKVHEWVENRITREGKIDSLKQRIYESLLTKLAGAIFFGILFFIGYGIFTYLFSTTPTLP